FIQEAVMLRRFVTRSDTRSVYACALALVASWGALTVAQSGGTAAAPQAAAQAAPIGWGDKDLLYVLTPGRWSPPPDEPLAYGGAGILIYDARHDFRLLKRISTNWDYSASQPIGVENGSEFIRGVTANVATGLLYVSTPSRLAAFDLR